MPRELTARAMAGFQARRLRNAWLGEDLSTLVRLEREGRVIRGTGTYGNPKVRTFPEEPDLRLIIGNYSAVDGNYLLGGQHAVRHVASFPFRIRYGLPGAGEDGNPAKRDPGDIVIGSDTWVTFDTWTMGGVTIGHGAVVTPASVVVKDVPPYAIVGGNPAKLIRYRFSPEQIEALLEISWWDWPHEQVMAAIPHLANEDVDGFIRWATETGGRRP